MLAALPVVMPQRAKPNEYKYQIGQRVIYDPSPGGGRGSHHLPLGSAGTIVDQGNTDYNAKFGPCPIYKVKINAYEHSLAEWALVPLFRFRIRTSDERAS